MKLDPADRRRGAQRGAPHSSLIPRLLRRTLAVACLGLWGGSALAQSGDSIALPGAPDYYIVQPGDTLWDIAQTFTGDPQYWPKLWSFNSEITNPHWIYPGNRIVFRQGTLVEPPQVGLETPVDTGGYVVSAPRYTDREAQCGPDVRFTEPRAAERYHVPGFLVHQDDLEVYGSLDKARTERTLFADDTLVYVRMDDPDAFECGDVVSFYELLDKKVRHPETRKRKLGGLYRVLGEGVVVHTYEDYTSVRIRNSWSELERGVLVGPTVPVEVEVEVATPSGDTEATIVTRLTREATLAGTREVVFLDQGRGDGLRVGDAFYIYEQRDPWLDKEEDLELPPSVIGRVVVVRVDEEHSAAVVVDSERPIKVGHRVASRID